MVLRCLCVLVLADQRATAFLTFLQRPQFAALLACQPGRLEFAVAQVLPIAAEAVDMVAVLDRVAAGGLRVGFILLLAGNQLTHELDPVRTPALLWRVRHRGHAEAAVAAGLVGGAFFTGSGFEQGDPLAARSDPLLATGSA